MLGVSIIFFDRLFQAVGPAIEKAMSTNVSQVVGTLYQLLEDDRSLNCEITEDVMVSSLAMYP